MNDRLLKIMEYFNYSPSLFADEIGVIRSSISHIISGRNNPGVELIQKVLIRFPQISTDWLLLGRGEMIPNDQDIGKKRMTIVNQPQPKKLGQLNLDDFTTANQSRIPDPKPGKIEAEPDNSQEKKSTPPQEVIKEEPPVGQVNADTHGEVKPAEPAADDRPAAIASVAIAEAERSVRVSKVKRITVFFEDHSFQDFVESK